jgi:phosphohistidine swiveling domain-containing protein
MIRETGPPKRWKQINYRCVSTGLGVEFLHDLYDRYRPEVNALRFRNTLTFWKDGQVRSFAPEDEWAFLAKWLGERFKRGDRDLREEIERYVADPKDRLARFFDKMKSAVLAELDDIGLGLLLVDFHYTVLTTIYGINLVQLEHALSHAIEEKCREYFPDAPDRDRAIASLLTSEPGTVAVEEEKAFLAIVLEGLRQGVLEISGEDSPAARAVLAHHGFYSSIHSAYGAAPQSLEDAVRRYNDLAREGLAGLERRLDDIRAAGAARIEAGKRCQDVIRDDPILQENFRLMRSIMHLRDRNKALLGTAVQARAEILSEIARRSSVPRDELDLYFLSELCDLLSDRTRIPDETLQRRRDGLVVVRKEYVTTGPEAALDVRSEGSLRGVCASPGKVRGTVRIVLTAGDEARMGRGDIMVAPGTDYDLIGCMQNAGGIVTEEGGMLSHAATISRELGIPCLIDVAGATTVLKEGMAAELDADEEIVRILGDPDADDA